MFLERRVNSDFWSGFNSSYCLCSCRSAMQIYTHLQNVYIFLIHHLPKLQGERKCSKICCVHTYRYATLDIHYNSRVLYPHFMSHINIFQNSPIILFRYSVAVTLRIVYRKKNLSLTICFSSFFLKNSIWRYEWPYIDDFSVFWGSATSYLFPVLAFLFSQQTIQMLYYNNHPRSLHVKKKKLRIAGFHFIILHLNFQISSFCYWFSYKVVKIWLTSRKINQICKDQFRSLLWKSRESNIV